MTESWSKCPKSFCLSKFLLQEAPSATASFFSLSSSSQPEILSHLVLRQHFICSSPEVLGPLGYAFVVARFQDKTIPCAKSKEISCTSEYGFPNSLWALRGEKGINGVAQLLDPMIEAFLGKESWLSFTRATQHGEATEEKGSRGALGCPGTQAMRIGEEWSRVLIQLHHALHSTGPQ